jgi:hypothetical protein
VVLEMEKAKAPGSVELEVKAFRFEKRRKAASRMQQAKRRERVVSGEQ